MNLREFTESIDKLAEKMTKEELQMVLHSFARKIPEVQRAEFIDILKEITAHKMTKRKKTALCLKQGNRTKRK